MTIRELLKTLEKGGYVVVNNGRKPLGTRVFRTGKRYTIHEGLTRHCSLGLNKAIKLFEDLIAGEEQSRQQEPLEVSE